MRVLHAYNLHRGGGGSDTATLATIRVLREGGVEVEEFARDSRDIPLNLLGKTRAFLNGLYARDAVREFDRALDRRAPDVVHVHELYPLISPWILPICARAGIPVVMTCYDFRLVCPIASHYANGEICNRCAGGREHWCAIRNCRSNVPESLAYALRSAVARWFDLYNRHVSRFVVVSTFSQDRMTQHAGVATERITRIPPPIRLPPEAVRDPAAGQYVAFAGRFVPEKGVEIMMEACRREGLPMAFAGDAPTHPAARPEDRAHFVMTRTPAELAQFYRGARVLAAPSLYYETFNIVAAEAMSHGVPVVASRIGALPETVPDGEGGLLFPPGDAKQLAACLRTVWDDARLCRELGRSARQHVIDEFTEQAHFERTTRVYREVIASGAAEASALERQ